MGPREGSQKCRNPRVTFEEATVLFTSGAPVLEIYDVEHSVYEDRFKSIGPIENGMVLVVWTERNHDTIRIISAWWATEEEQAMYLEFLETTNE